MKLQVDTASVYWSLNVIVAAVAVLQALELGVARHNYSASAEVAVAFALGVRWADSLLLEIVVLEIVETCSLAVTHWVVFPLYTIDAVAGADPFDMGGVI